MNFPAKKVMQRYSFIATLMVMVGVAVLARATYIMTVKKDYWMAVSQRFVKKNQTVEPARGSILAANGEVLAASLPEYKMYMDFMSWEKDSVRRTKEQHKRDSVLEVKMDSICTKSSRTSTPWNSENSCAPDEKQKATTGNSTTNASPTSNIAW